MQFKVPQFLEIEDKIFGPFTFKEFAYLAGGGGICFVLYRLLGLYLGFIPIALVAGLSAALTFYKPNNKPFVYMLEAGIQYLMQDKLYIWKRREVTAEERRQVQTKASTIVQSPANKLTGSKLRDLAWSLDVLDLKK
jgi:PrgI family protein